MSLIVLSFNGLESLRKLALNRRALRDSHYSWTTSVPAILS